MALVAPLLVAGWTLTAVFAQSPSPAASAAGDPTHGSQLYSQTCTACHGANLEGGVGPKLNPIQNLGNTKDPLSPQYLEGVITHGLQGVGGYSTAMPAKGGNTSLTQKDIADIAAYIIQTNKQGPAGLDPVQLARSNVFWVTVSVALLVLVTWLLARYNMRWIARRAAATRERDRGER
jgi:mono/diheme cytochrome c family protein